MGTAKLRSLHTPLEDLVQDFLESHQRLHRRRLLLAIWFDRSNTEDIHLIEVYEGFPDSGSGDLSTYGYGPGVTFPLTGKLFLTMCAPKEFVDACRIGHPLIVAARKDGKIVGPKSVLNKAEFTARGRLALAFHGKT